MLSAFCLFHPLRWSASRFSSVLSVTLSAFVFFAFFVSASGKSSNVSIFFFSWFSDFQVFLFCIFRIRLSAFLFFAPFFFFRCCAASVFSCLLRRFCPLFFFFSATSSAPFGFGSVFFFPLLRSKRAFQGLFYSLSASLSVGFFAVRFFCLCLEPPVTLKVTNTWQNLRKASRCKAFRVFSFLLFLPSKTPVRSVFQGKS